MTKSQTEGVKDNVCRANIIYSKLIKCRGELHVEFRTKMHVANKKANTSSIKITDRVYALETKVLGVLDRVIMKITDQDRTLEKLVVLPAPTSAVGLEVKRMEVKWTEVVKKPRKGPSATTITTKTANEEPKTSLRAVKPLRVRPLALMVKKDGKDFPMLLKTVRKKVDPGVTGNAMSKTRTGNLLIVINVGKVSAEVVRAEVKKSLEAGAKIRKLNDESPVEIWVLDREVIKEEVLKVVSGSE